MVVVLVLVVVVLVAVEQPLTTAVRSQSSSIERDKACESVPCVCALLLPCLSLFEAKKREGQRRALTFSPVKDGERGDKGVMSRRGIYI